jgi:hypothetical protein
MSTISTKINNLDENVINSKECQDALRSLYDQVNIQPVEVGSFGIQKMNKLFFVGVGKSSKINIDKN